MAFNGELQFLGTQGQYGQKIWMYQTSDDSVATCLSSGYFNNVYDQIKLDDLLILKGNNYTRFCRFTSAQGVQPVTADFMEPGFQVGSTSPANCQVMEIEMDAGATANSDLFIPHDIRVLDVMLTVSSTGAAGDTFQVQTESGAANITNAMDLNVAGDSVVRAGQIFGDNVNVESGSNKLRLRKVAGGASASKVDVRIFYALS